MKYNISTPLAILVLALTTASSAQRVSFGAPAAHAKIHAGSNFTVQVNFQDTTSSVSNDQLIISMQGCQSGPCSAVPPGSDPTSVILYNGPYKPTAGQGQGHPGFFQSFNVTCPEFGNHKATIFLTHVFGLGAALTPIVEFEKLPVRVINPNGPF